VKWWLIHAWLLWPAIVLMAVAVTCLGLAGAGTWTTVGVVLVASTTGFVVTEWRRGRRNRGA